MSGTFSERFGHVEPKQLAQRTSIDQRLRNRIWSRIFENFLVNKYGPSRGRGAETLFLVEIWDNFFGWPSDTIPEFFDSAAERIKKGYFSLKWNEVYDIVEFLIDQSAAQCRNSEEKNEIRHKSNSFAHEVQKILEEEKSAYRLVANRLVEITDEIEIQEVEKALKPAARFSAPREHLATALRYYGNREHPDYRNSIKESVSSIEGILFEINGQKSQNMDAALREVGKSGISLHPALKRGISNIYGWTSDENGVRHAMTSSGVAVTENEARLMLVLCSALVNYLVAEVSKKSK